MRIVANWGFITRRFSLWFCCALLCCGFSLSAQQEKTDSVVTLETLHLYLDREPAEAESAALELLRMEYNPDGHPLLRYYFSGGAIPASFHTAASVVFTRLLVIPWVRSYPSSHIDHLPVEAGLNTPNIRKGGLSYSLPEEMRAEQQMRKIWERLSYRRPELFAYSQEELNKYRINLSDIKPETIYLADSIAAMQEDNIRWLAGLNTVLKKRKYWSPSFESTLQFSQNYVSSNWHKGGASNINLFSRDFLAIEYKRGKVKWNNELEAKLSVYNAQGDTLRKYRVADDLLRLRSNFGYQAYRRWYYSADMETRTQLFTAHKENSREIQAAFLAPLSLDFGLGMQYALEKKSHKVYGRKFKLKLNLAPFSYNMKWSPRSDIDLPRHGFEKGEQFLQRVGSSVKAEFAVDFNLNLSWQSRLYYITSYQSITAEWENTINLALTKHFSTRLYLYLRYDDSAPIANVLGRYLQTNELTSFGFNYRF